MPDDFTNRAILMEWGVPSTGNSLVVTPLPMGQFNFSVEGDSKSNSITLHPQQCVALMTWLGRQL